LREPSAPDS